MRRTSNASSNSSNTRLTNYNTNANSNTNENDSDPRYVLPRPFTRIIRNYSSEPGSFAERLKMLDDDYQRWVVFAEHFPRIQPRMKRIVPMMVRWMSEWIQLKLPVLALSRNLNSTETEMRSKFRFMKMVRDYYKKRMQREYDYRDGAAVMAFFWTLMIVFPFLLSIETVRSRLSKEKTRTLSLTQKRAMRELRNLRHRREDANIATPTTVRVDEDRRYSNQGRYKTATWLARVKEKNIPNNVPQEKKFNLMTLEPITRGIPLKCGHWLTKPTLEGMVRAGSDLRCPFCREPIYKQNITRK